MVVTTISIGDRFVGMVIPGSERRVQQECVRVPRLVVSGEPEDLVLSGGTMWPGTLNVRTAGVQTLRPACLATAHWDLWPVEVTTPERIIYDLEPEEAYIVDFLDEDSPPERFVELVAKGSLRVAFGKPAHIHPVFCVEIKLLC